MVRIGDFVNVDKQAFNKGLVVASQPIPFSEDEYNVRIHLVICPVDEWGNVDTGEFVVLDPTFISNVSEGEQMKLVELFNDRFKKKVIN